MCGRRRDRSGGAQSSSPLGERLRDRRFLKAAPSHPGLWSHYSKFVRPGYPRVDVTEPSTVNEVYVSAYDGENPAIVALNMDNISHRIRFKIRNHDISELQRYRTTKDHTLAQDTVQASGSSFT